MVLLVAFGLRAQATGSSIFTIYVVQDEWIAIIVALSGVSWNPNAIGTGRSLTGKPRNI
jgi:hypothetical protein